MTRPVVPEAAPTALIVGGSGFLGTELVREFGECGMVIRNADIVPPKIPSAPYLTADVRDERALVSAMQGVSIAYNLAAEWQDDVRPVERYYEVNVEGARRFCSAAELCGVNRIVFVSSVSVYGIPPDEAREETPLRPHNHYGRSKMEAEAVYISWAKGSAERSLTIVRPSVICGPGNRGNVYNLIKQILSGGFFMVGSGTNRKSMSYVVNVAAFLRHCEQFGPGIRVFNYADKPDFSVGELVSFIDAAVDRPVGRRRLPLAVALTIAAVAEKAALLVGGRSRLTVERVRKFCANTQISAERAYATGFRPRVTLQEGLRHVLASDFGRETSQLSTRSPLQTEVSGGSLDFPRPSRS